MGNPYFPEDEVAQPAPVGNPYFPETSEPTPLNAGVPESLMPSENWAGQYQKIQTMKANQSATKSALDMRLMTGGHDSVEELIKVGEDNGWLVKELLEPSSKSLLERGTTIAKGALKDKTGKALNNFMAPVDPSIPSPTGGMIPRPLEQAMLGDADVEAVLSRVNSIISAIKGGTYSTAAWVADKLMRLPASVAGAASGFTKEGLRQEGAKSGDTGPFNLFNPQPIDLNDAFGGPTSKTFDFNTALADSFKMAAEGFSGNGMRMPHEVISDLYEWGIEHVRNAGAERNGMKLGYLASRNIVNRNLLTYLSPFIPGLEMDGLDSLSDDEVDDIIGGVIGGGLGTAADIYADPTAVFAPQVAAALRVPLRVAGKALRANKVTRGMMYGIQRRAALNDMLSEGVLAHPNASPTTAKQAQAIEYVTGTMPRHQEDLANMIREGSAAGITPDDMGEILLKKSGEWEPYKAAVAKAGPVPSGGGAAPAVESLNLFTLKTVVKPGAPTPSEYIMKVRGKETVEEGFQAMLPTLAWKAAGEEAIGLGVLKVAPRRGVAVPYEARGMLSLPDPPLNFPKSKPYDFGPDPIPSTPTKQGDMIQSFESGPTNFNFPSAVNAGGSSAPVPGGYAEGQNFLSSLSAGMDPAAQRTFKQAPSIPNKWLNLEHGSRVKSKDVVHAVGDLPEIGEVIPLPGGKKGITRVNAQRKAKDPSARKDPLKGQVNDPMNRARTDHIIVVDLPPKGMPLRVPSNMPTDPTGSYEFMPEYIGRWRAGMNEPVIPQAVEAAPPPFQDWAKNPKAPEQAGMFREPPVGAPGAAKGAAGPQADAFSPAGRGPEPLPSQAEMANAIYGKRGHAFKPPDRQAFELPQTVRPVEALPDGWVPLDGNSPMHEGFRLAAGGKGTVHVPEMAKPYFDNISAMYDRRGGIVGVASQLWAALHTSILPSHHRNNVAFEDIARTGQMMFDWTSLISRAGEGYGAVQAGAYRYAGTGAAEQAAKRTADIAGNTVSLEEVFNKLHDYGGRSIGIDRGGLRGGRGLGYTQYGPAPDPTVFGSVIKPLLKGGQKFMAGAAEFGIDMQNIWEATSFIDAANHYGKLAGGKLTPEVWQKAALHARAAHYNNIATAPWFNELQGWVPFLNWMTSNTPAALEFAFTHPAYTRVLAGVHAQGQTPGLESLSDKRYIRLPMNAVEMEDGTILTVRSKLTHQAATIFQIMDTADYLGDIISGGVKEMAAQGNKVSGFLDLLGEMTPPVKVLADLHTLWKEKPLITTDAEFAERLAQAFGPLSPVPLDFTADDAKRWRNSKAAAAQMGVIAGLLKEVYRLRVIKGQAPNNAKRDMNGTPPPPIEKTLNGLWINIQNGAQP